MSTGTKEDVEVVVAPFGIEADHPRNCDLYIQCVPNLRLRSAIDGTKHTTDSQGRTMVPLDQARHLAAFPRLPGMRLIVDPANLTYEVIDPLHGDKPMEDRIRRFLKDMSGAGVEKLTGVPPKKGELDKHRMKSLCREMKWLVDSGEAKRFQGRVPSMEEIDELPGEFLLNPGSRVANGQPIFEKDFEDWHDNLNRSGS